MQKVLTKPKKALYLYNMKQRSNNARLKNQKLCTMKNSPFTIVEDFNPNDVASAFISLAQDGTTAKDDNGMFYEFIRANSDLFPGLDTRNQDAMKHANSLCQEVWRMNEEEISENYAG